MSSNDTAVVIEPPALRIIRIILSVAIMLSGKSYIIAFYTTYSYNLNNVILSTFVPTLSSL